MNPNVIEDFAQSLEIIRTLKKKDLNRVHRASSFAASTYEALNFPSSLMEEDHEFARSLGLKFQASHVADHDEAIAWLRTEIECADLASLFRAFVVGLRPSAVLWRAPMRAFAAYAQLPLHKSKVDRQYVEKICKECGLTPKTKIEPVALALSVHCAGTTGNGIAETVAALESAIILCWFRQNDPPDPTQKEIDLLDAMLVAIDEAPPQTTANGLDPLVRTVLKGDKYTRRYLIETLAFMGVLKNPRQPPDMDTWTRWEHRDFGKSKNQEIIPPACTWRRSDGVDIARIRAMLPEDSSSP